MVEQTAPLLQKKLSTIPTAAVQVESTILPVSIDLAWDKFRNFRWDQLAPGLVKSVAWTDGAPARVGSTARLTYAGGVTWTVRLTEVSERHHTVAFELLEADPPVQVTSLQAELRLLRVSDDNTTFLSWTSEFSNDVCAEIIQDQKYKKLDFFAAFAKHFSTDESSFNWPPLEGNPEIFSDYMAKGGLDPAKYAFNEIFGFEEDLLCMVPAPRYGVIICAERLKKAEDKQMGSLEVANEFYMDQTNVLDNACGIIACLHVIYNNLSADKIVLEEGKALKNFIDAQKGKGNAEIATAMENNNEFKEAQHTFAAQGQSNQAQEQSDVCHHFIAYVINGKGQLIELDGTKKGPVVIKETCSDVLADSVGEVKRRLADGEISEKLSMMSLNVKGEF